MTGSDRPLVFVYNADSGAVNAVIDLAHKICAPSSYRCNLCAVTWSPIGMRRRWKRFIARLARPVEFLYRGELRERYGVHDIPLPAAFERAGDRLIPRISAAEIEACGTLGDLETLVSRVVYNGSRAA